MARATCFFGWADWCLHDTLFEGKDEHVLLSSQNYHLTATSVEGLRVFMCYVRPARLTLLYCLCVHAWTCMHVYTTHSGSYDHQCPNALKHHIVQPAHLCIMHSLHSHSTEHSQSRQRFLHRHPRRCRVERSVDTCLGDKSHGPTACISQVARMSNYATTDKVLLLLCTWKACRLLPTKSAPDVELQHAWEELTEQNFGHMRAVFAFRKL